MAKKSDAQVPVRRGSGRAPAVLPEIDHSLLLYNDEDVINKARSERRKTYKIVSVIFMALGSPLATFIGMEITDKPLLGLLFGIVVFLIGNFFRSYFTKKSKLGAPSLRSTTPPSQDADNGDDQEVSTPMSTPTEAPTVPTTASGSTVAADQPVATTNKAKRDKPKTPITKVSEVSKVFTHRIPQLRLQWQPRLPALAVLAIGYLFYLRAAAKGLANFGSLVITILAVAGIAYIVYRLSRNRLAYKPTEENVGDKIMKELTDLRAKEAAELAAAQAEEMARQEAAQAAQAAQRASAEAIEAVKQAKRDAIADRERRIQYMTNCGLQGIIGEVGVKSGSKSVRAIDKAKQLAEVSRKNVLIMPATLNTSTGTLGMMVSVVRKKISVSSLELKIKDVNTYRELSRILPLTEDGLAVISEDMANKNSAAGKYDAAAFIRIILKLVPNVDFIVLDFGNDNIQDGSIALAAIQSCHVLNVPHMVGSGVTITMAQQTVGQMAFAPTALEADKHGLTDAQKATLALTGVNIPMQTKLERLILIGSKSDDGTVPDWEEIINPTPDPENKDYEPHDTIDWKGIGITTPTDPHLAQLGQPVKGGGTVTYDRNLISEDSKLAGLNILVANLETMALVQKHPLPGYKPLFVQDLLGGTPAKAIEAASEEAVDTDTAAPELAPAPAPEQHDKPSDIPSVEQQSPAPKAIGSHHVFTAGVNPQPVS